MGTLAGPDLAVLIREENFHAPVELPARLCRIACNGQAFAIPSRRYAVGTYAHSQQGVAYRIGALFGKLLVALVTAGAIGKSFDSHCPLGMLVKNVGKLLHLTYASRFKARAIGIEQDIVQRDYQPSLRLICIQFGKL